MTDPWPETFDFMRQVKAWDAPPAGGVNTASAFVLRWTSKQVRKWGKDTQRAQYAQPANKDGLYRKWLGLDDTVGKTVMDFGCGLGFDALQYAQKGNRVILADIVKDNVWAANRLFDAFSYKVERRCLITPQYPFFGRIKFDVFHASGVLHHTPKAREILERLHCDLADDGEVRLMLYSDRSWEWATGLKAPPITGDVVKHPAFRSYVRRMDAVGYYADWYSRAKLERLVYGIFTVDFYDYLKNDAAYCVARLIKKE